MDETYTGRCLCGAVRYEAKGAPVVVAQCHCEACRRLSGTGHSVGAMFPEVKVSVRGELGIFEYTSAQGSQVSKAFCKGCGSPIYGKNTRMPDHITIPLGSMDDAAGLGVEVVIFQRDMPHWDHLGQDVACFATQPDWTPDG